MTPSQETCELANYYFNSEAFECQKWITCPSVNEEPSSVLNLCEKVSRTEDYCTGLELAYDDQKLECVETDLDVTVCGQN